METKYYLDKFQKVVDQLDDKAFKQVQLDLKVGIWMDSVCLKIQKKSWANQSQTTKPFEESIFFSIWINEESIQESKLYYNIHAFKLRQLTGYSIKSREFADAFRSRFQVFKYNWPNVSLDFGPLTLMQGYVEIDLENFENAILELANQFLEIQFIIDDLLEERSK